MININTLEEFKKLNYSTSELDDFLSYSIIYDHNSEATDEEVEIIYNASKRAWLKDENHYDKCEFIDFLAENYFDGTLSLDDIYEASGWDILQDVVNGDVCNIKSDELDK